LALGLAWGLVLVAAMHQLLAVAGRPVSQPVGTGAPQAWKSGPAARATGTCWPAIM
jgi:hypothetical protein